MPKSYDEIRKKLLDMEIGVLRGDAQAVEKQHQGGKWTARERIAKLLDPGSFVEEFLLAETQKTDFGMAREKAPTTVW